MGLERAQRAVASLGHPPGAALDHLDAVRLDLQLTALAGDWEALAQIAGEAKTLARRACAPTLRWIADWASAAAVAAVGESAQAVERAKQVANSLERYGEPYTGARLLVDLLPFLEGDARKRTRSGGGRAVRGDGRARERDGSGGDAPPYHSVAAASARLPC